MRIVVVQFLWVGDLFVERQLATSVGDENFHLQSGPLLPLPVLLETGIAGLAYSAFPGCWLRNATHRAQHHWSRLGGLRPSS